jgi:sulfoxide reductase heme-binding subunit YedZ
MSSRVTAIPSRPQQARLRRRLLLHHLSIFAASAALFLLLYFTRPYKDLWMKLSFSTAYPALFLILLTLSIGPYNVLTRRRNPVSSDLRRDIGIWAGIFSVIHTVVGQNVHLRGRPWLYYLYEHRERHWLPLRHDLFGFSNYTGFIATLIVIALLATSNDYSLRRLGTPQWKRLQRWNYAAFALIGAHAIGYLTIETQKLPFVLTIALGLAATVAIQTAGYHRRRTALGR